MSKKIELKIEQSASSKGLVLAWHLHSMMLSQFLFSIPFKTFGLLQISGEANESDFACFATSI